MSPIVWRKVVAAAEAAGVTEQQLYDDSNLRSRFAAIVGGRGGRVTARRRKMSAKVAAVKPKQLTLNLF